MARRTIKRDKIGRFANTGGVTYGNRGDRDSDARWAKRETSKLNKAQTAVQQKLDRLKASAPPAKAAAAKSGLAAARAKKAAATEKLAASKSRLTELREQMAASRARLGGKSATKRGARR